MSKTDWSTKHRTMQDRQWLAALANPNCVTDGATLRGVRFGLCGCGAIEALLARESGDRFRCCDCRGEAAAVAVRRTAAAGTGSGRLAGGRSGSIEREEVADGQR